MNFVQLMASKDFQTAAELLFDSIMDFEIPNNVTINIDRQSNVIDLTEQLKSIYLQLQEQSNELIKNLSSTKIVDEVLSHETLKDKPLKLTREQLISVSDKTLETFIENKFKRDLETVFDSIVATSQGTIKGLITAANEI
jgi:hypothetical protein